jgi:hypothetical protein
MPDRFERVTKQKAGSLHRSEQIRNHRERTAFDPSKQQGGAPGEVNTPLNFRRFKAGIDFGVDPYQLASFLQIQHGFGEATITHEATTTFTKIPETTDFARIIVADANLCRSLQAKIDLRTIPAQGIAAGHEAPTQFNRISQQFGFACLEAGLSGPSDHHTAIKTFFHGVFQLRSIFAREIRLMILTFAERKYLCIKVDATNDSFQLDELGMRGECFPFFAYPIPRIACEHRFAVTVGTFRHTTDKANSLDLRRDETAW